VDPSGVPSYIARRTRPPPVQRLWGHGDCQKYVTGAISSHAGNVHFGRPDRGCGHRRGRMSWTVTGYCAAAPALVRHISQFSTVMRTKNDGNVHDCGKELPRHVPGIDEQLRRQATLSSAVESASLVLGAERCGGAGVNGASCGSSTCDLVSLSAGVSRL
jgi:hypothetical protein